MPRNCPRKGLGAMPGTSGTSRPDLFNLHIDWTECPRDKRDSSTGQMVRADFREGNEDSNFSVFRPWRFSGWPGALH